MKAMVGVWREAFLQLKNMWNLEELSLKTKNRILNANIKTVVLDGVETRGITTTIIKKLQVLINSRLYRILRSIDQRSSAITDWGREKTNWGGNKVKISVVYNICFAEIIRLDHKSRPNFESQMQKEKTQIKQHIGPEIEDKHRSMNCNWQKRKWEPRMGQWPIPDDREQA